MSNTVSTAAGKSIQSLAKRYRDSIQKEAMNGVEKERPTTVRGTVTEDEGSITEDETAKRIAKLSISATDINRFARVTQPLVESKGRAAEVSHKEIAQPESNRFRDDAGHANYGPFVKVGKQIQDENDAFWVAP